MKKSFLWLIVLILSISIITTFSLIGCKEAEEPAEEEVAEEVEEEPAEEEPAEVVELEYWSLEFGPAEVWIPMMQALVEQFNDEHPNIHVTYQDVPWDSWYETFITAVTAGEAPDVAIAAANMPQQYTEMGETIDLTPIIEEWKESGIYDDYHEGYLEQYSYMGMIPGIGWMYDPRQITYRKDVFEEVGITEEPDTWDEFIDALRKVKEGSDLIPFVTGTTQNAGHHITVHMAYSNGTGYANENYEANLTDPKFIEVFEFFKTLYDEELMSAGVSSYTFDDAETIFDEGKAATLLTKPPLATLGTDLGDKCGILPALQGPSADQPGALTWVGPMMGFSQTENPDECRVFIQWILENNLAWWTEGGCSSFPARISYFEDPVFDDWVHQEISEKVLPYTKYQDFWPSGYFPGAVPVEGENILGSALQEIFGGADVETVAEKYNAELNDLFESMEE